MRTKPFFISAETVFVAVSTVRATRGITSEQVCALVKSGEYNWVFDIGEISVQQTHNRQLRFWVRELLEPRAVANLKLADALLKILPRARSTYNGADLGRLLLVSRKAGTRIARELSCTKKDRIFRVPRAKLATWLRRRWIGGRG